MTDTIPVVMQDLPPHIHGFCCLGSDYEPCIVLNSRLSYEQQIQTYHHEINHIRRGDMFNEGYVEYE